MILGVWVYDIFNEIFDLLERDYQNEVVNEFRGMDV